MEDKKPVKCTWFRIVELISNPEGYLKICHLECDGLNTDCQFYTPNMKGVINDFDYGNIPNGLERYFVYPYHRSNN